MITACSFRYIVLICLRQLPRASLNLDNFGSLFSFVSELIWSKRNCFLGFFLQTDSISFLLFSMLLFWSFGWTRLLVIRLSFRFFWFCICQAVIRFLLLGLIIIWLNSEHFVTFLNIWILLQIIGPGSVPHDHVFRLQLALDLAFPWINTKRRIFVKLNKTENNYGDGNAV